MHRTSLRVCQLAPLVPPARAQEKTQTVSKEAVSGLATTPNIQEKALGRESAVVIHSWLIVVAVVASIYLISVIAKVTNSAP